MSCSVSERLSEDRSRSGTCRIRRVFSNNFSSASSSKGANNRASSSSPAVAIISTSETPAESSSSSANSIDAKAGGSAEATALTESTTSIGAASAEASASSSKPASKCKPRCLCWCYCCSCICVTPVKGKGTKGVEIDPVNELLICEGEPIPTLDEIRAWGKSFDTLMTSPVGRQVFGEFLKLEYSDENILFWLGCEDLKLETNPDIIAEKVRLLYEGYISILSPKEVSLDSHVREIVNRNMVEPTTHTFDEAQMQIYTLMMRDSYPRFVNSALYKSLAQEVEEDAREPSVAGSDHVDSGESVEPQSQV